MFEGHKSFFAEHRHKVGSDGYSQGIILVTQDLSQICRFVRDLIEETFRAVKLTAIGQSKKYRLDIYQGAVTGQAPPEGRRLWQIFGEYKQDIFALYKSHTMSETGGAGSEKKADDRANVLKSAGIKFMLPLAVVLMLGGAWKVSTFFVKDEPKAETMQMTPAPFAGWVDVGARHYAVLDSKRGSLYQPATICRGQRDNPRCMFEGEVVTRWTGPELEPDRVVQPLQTFNAAPPMQPFNPMPDQALTWLLTYPTVRKLQIGKARGLGHVYSHYHHQGSDHHSQGHPGRAAFRVWGPDQLHSGRWPGGVHPGHQGHSNPQGLCTQTQAACLARCYASGHSVAGRQVVKGIDTNILVRYLVQDELHQAAKATRFIETHCTEQTPGFIGHIVLCELVWVLEVSYNLDRADIATILEDLLQVGQIDIMEPPQVWKALHEYKASNADFSDHLLAHQNAEYGCTSTVTFDKKKAGKQPLFELLK